MENLNQNNIASMRERVDALHFKLNKVTNQVSDTDITKLGRISNILFGEQTFMELLSDLTSITDIDGFINELKTNLKYVEENPNNQSEIISSVFITKLPHIRDFVASVSDSHRSFDFLIETLETVITLPSVLTTLAKLCDNPLFYHYELISDDERFYNASSSLDLLLETMSSLPKSDIKNIKHIISDPASTIANLGVSILNDIDAKSPVNLQNVDNAYQARDIVEDLPQTQATLASMFKYVDLCDVHTTIMDHMTSHYQSVMDQILEVTMYGLTKMFEQRLNSKFISIDLDLWVDSIEQVIEHNREWTYELERENVLATSHQDNYESISSNEGLRHIYGVNDMDRIIKAKTAITKHLKVDEVLTDLCYVFRKTQITFKTNEYGVVVAKLPEDKEYDVKKDYIAFKVAQKLNDDGCVKSRSDAPSNKFKNVSLDACITALDKERPHLMSDTQDTVDTLFDDVKQTIEEPKSASIVAITRFMIESSKRTFTIRDFNNRRTLSYTLRDSGHNVTISSANILPFVKGLAGEIGPNIQSDVLKTCQLLLDIYPYNGRGTNIFHDDATPKGETLINKFFDHLDSQFGKGGTAFYMLYPWMHSRGELRGVNNCDDLKRSVVTGIKSGSGKSILGDLQALLYGKDLVKRTNMRPGISNGGWNNDQRSWNLVARDFAIVNMDDNDKNVLQSAFDVYKTIYNKDSLIIGTPKLPEYATFNGYLYGATNDIPAQFTEEAFSRRIFFLKFDKPLKFDERTGKGLTSEEINEIAELIQGSSQMVNRAALVKVVLERVDDAIAWVDGYVTPDLVNANSTLTEVGALKQLIVSHMHLFRTRLRNEGYSIDDNEIYVPMSVVKNEMRTCDGATLTAPLIRKLFLDTFDTGQKWLETVTREVKKGERTAIEVVGYLKSTSGRGGSSSQVINLSSNIKLDDLLEELGLVDNVSGTDSDIQSYMKRNLAVVDPSDIMAVVNDVNVIVAETLLGKAKSVLEPASPTRAEGTITYHQDAVSDDDKQLAIELMMKAIDMNPSTEFTNSVCRTLVTSLPIQNVLMHSHLAVAHYIASFDMSSSYTSWYPYGDNKALVEYFSRSQVNLNREVVATLVTTYRDLRKDLSEVQVTRIKENTMESLNAFCEKVLIEHHKLQEEAKAKEAETKKQMAMMNAKPFKLDHNPFA